MRANLQALATLQAVQAAGRPATPAEQARLARWSGWGAVPEAFDSRREDFAWARDELARLLSPQELAAAARTTLNAHYTDAELTKAIWGGLRRLGFTGGQVLEPGCGSGNFIGFAPAGARMVGVELDPTTAAIAAALYPDAQVLTESFADTRAPEGSFDLAVGNVPFGRFALTDRRHNPGGHSIHNHFIIKSLHLTRPGGLVAVLTSRYTLDARNPAARREIAELADLVGAVRLPSTAHQQAAGTRVVTDLLVLRRREPDREPEPLDWEQVQAVELDDGPVEINRYFLDNPQHVLGAMSSRHGAYRGDDLVVVADAETPPAQALAAALETIAVDAARRGLTMTAADDGAGEREARPAALVGQRSALQEGHLQAGEDGTFSQLVAGQLQPYEVPASQAGELRALLGLRDAVVALLEAEAASLDDTPALDRLRGELNRRYDAYVERFGPINRFSWRRTGRVDPDTGAERMARVGPRQGGFKTDPFATVVYALEHFDPVSQQARKAEVFSQRVVAPRRPRLGADSPADALAISLDTYGEVRLPEVARLLGTSEPEARQGLGGLVFDEPGTGHLVPRAEYLSGNVRAKLAAAREAAETDPAFAANVEALAEVIPADLGPDEVDARLGAAWIDATVVQQFLAELLDDDTIRVEHPGGSTWTVRGGRDTVLATSTWGTRRVPAPQIAQAVLEQRQIRVVDEVDDGKRVLNLTETVAAQEKAVELGARFAEWIWEDPARARELAAVYNEKFNAIVLRSYDDAELSLPGLAVSFKPRPHQVAAVARIVAEPAVLLGHVVGAGKTAEMAMGACELRRLGLARKPAIVVPNHMLDQIATEFLQLYPQARVLAATKEDLARDNRRAFVAKVATGDWDAVVLTRSAFERIPMSVPAQRAYMERELATIRGWITRSRAQGSLTVKRLERALVAAEERLKKKLDATKDPGITFEATGIDYLFVDEAHGYKNLRTVSNIPGAAIDGSMRASDLDMKIDYLRQTRGERVVTFATGTPIANSVTEAYVMQKYLRPDLLEAAGIEDFDSWAATFGEVVSEIELSPDGGSFRMQSRFAKFRNVPELLRMWHLSADIKTAEDLHLPRPALVGGTAETIVVEPSSELLDFVAELSARADKVRNRAVRPDEDNMLKISGDGRAAALDLRLMGLSTDEPTKVAVAADHIAEIWAAHRDDVYPRPDGADDPVRGSLQIVFCDLGTPREGWNVYDELREQLVARGLPAEMVRYVHEARNDREKSELFAACRAGRVAVLVGSTERMGAGTNIQARAVALHHLDCPWRPADLEQREGRILRQGNGNAEVRILRYVTEKSFDGYSWQTVERKARFIGQVMRGKLDMREIEDIGTTALSYSEVKALATGDPQLLEKAQADAELARLERLDRAWGRNQNTLRFTAAQAQSRIGELEGTIAAAEAAIARRRDTRGEAFAMTVDGHRSTKRTEAAAAVQALLAGEVAALGWADTRRAQIGQLGGFTATATVQRGLRDVEVLLHLVDVPAGTVTVRRGELAEGANPAGILTRLENKLTALERLRDDAAEEIPRLRTEIDRAQATIGQPFPQAEQLAAVRAKVAELTAAIEERARPPEEVHPEIEVLAAVLHNPGQLDRLREYLTPADFRDPDRGRIYAAAIATYTAGGPVTPHLVLDRAQATDGPLPDTTIDAVLTRYQRTDGADAAVHAKRVIETAIAASVQQATERPRPELAATTAPARAGHRAAEQAKQEADRAYRPPDPPATYPGASQGL